MTKIEHTEDARVLVGIDISKHRHEVLIATPGKQRRRKLTITNTAFAAKMARTIHAVVKLGDPYRPFFEGTSPGGRTPHYKGRGGRMLTS